MPNVFDFFKTMGRFGNQEVRAPPGDDANSTMSSSGSSTLLTSPRTFANKKHAGQGLSPMDAAVGLEKTIGVEKTIPPLGFPPLRSAPQLRSPATNSTIANVADEDDGPPDEDRCPKTYRLTPNLELGNFVRPGTTLRVNAGPRETFASMQEEWRKCTNMLQKVDGLIKLEYTGWRRIRGDGNCYYRAAGYGLLELLAGADHDIRCSRIKLLCEQLRDVAFMVKGRERSIHDELIKRIAVLGEKQPDEARRLSDPRLHAQRSLEIENDLAELLLHLKSVDRTLDAALIRALRNLCAKYLRETSTCCKDWQEGITPEILVETEGHKRIEEYLEKVILVPGAEAYNLAVEVLPRSLNIKIRIAMLLQRQEGPVVFQTTGVHRDEEPDRPDDIMVHVALRPGHYDLLYHKPCRRPLPDSTRLAADAPSFSADAPSTYFSAQNTAQKDVKPPNGFGMQWQELDPSLEKFLTSTLPPNFGGTFCCPRLPPTPSMRLPTPTFGPRREPQTPTFGPRREPSQFRAPPQSTDSARMRPRSRPPSFGDVEEMDDIDAQSFVSRLVPESRATDAEAPKPTRSQSFGGMLPRTYSEERRQLKQALRASVSEGGVIEDEEEQQNEFWNNIVNLFNPPSNIQTGSSGGTQLALGWDIVSNGIRRLHEQFGQSRSTAI